MTTPPWPAPAKLNLFLHVVGRRNDGYHLLQTAFQFIDHCDYLQFSLREDSAIQRTNPLPGVTADTDLTVRAARLLQQESGISQGVAITLDKRLPMGGGIGGGSSDAATTLVALNRLWETNLSQDDLAELGVRLGADVPVFIHGQAAWAEGIGEKLSPLTLRQSWFLILIPPCQVSTAEIFNAPELTRNTEMITIADFLSGRGQNDCEPLVRRRYPDVNEALNWLTEFGPARMSGTGACVFAAFEAKSDALNVHDALPPHWRGIVARGLNRSPLLERLATACERSK